MLIVSISFSWNALNDRRSIEVSKVPSSSYTEQVNCLKTLDHVSEKSFTGPNKMLHLVSATASCVSL